MNRVTVVENESFAVWVYPQRRLVHQQIRGPLSGSQFREVLTKGADVLAEYRATKWLSDDRSRKNTVDLESQRSWAVDVWFPRAVAAGWKYWALVQPEDPSFRLDMKVFVHFVYTMGIVVHVFNEMASANVWLDEQTVTNSSRNWAG
jgi:hypothetical protein